MEDSLDFIIFEDDELSHDFDGLFTDDDMPELETVINGLEAFDWLPSYRRCEEKLPSILFQTGECRGETKKSHMFNDLKGHNGEGIQIDYESLEDVYIPTRVTAFAVTTKSSMKCAWDMYDLGASHHMSPCREDFINFEVIPAKPLTAANKEKFMAEGIREMMIKLPNGDKEVKM